ncbi:MAG: hypothetical protein ACRDI2_19970, partial [Chloroflexota bacterium]
LETLAAAQQRTEAQLGTLLSWQEGENGRQKGERLERATVRGAVTLFAGGEGGTTEQPHVQRRLARQLGAFLQNGASNIPAEADPALADVLWWKDDTVAVVEVSVVVDEHDVRRAHFRAETLRQAGATAVAAVVGDTWADGEVRFLAADVYRLAYKVGQEVSDAYVAFRRLPANTAAE